MDNQKKYHGYYSDYQAKKFGFCLYKTPDGDVIKITEAVEIGHKLNNKWNDNVFLGEITECVKTNGFSFADYDKLNTQQLYERIVEMKQEQDRCQKQFSKTNTCFCHTCPIKFNDN